MHHPEKGIKIALSIAYSIAMFSVLIEVDITLIINWEISKLKLRKVTLMVDLGSLKCFLMNYHPKCLVNVKAMI